MLNGPIEDAGHLRRRLGLPLLVLYGTGISVGAGIYVLIGAVAEHAGCLCSMVILVGRRRHGVNSCLLH